MTDQERAVKEAELEKLKEEFAMRKKFKAECKCCGE